MPIYEYHCSDCDHVTEKINLSSSQPDTSIPCGSCGGVNTHRILSSFSHRSRTSGTQNSHRGECCGGTGGENCIPGSCCSSHNH